MGSFQAYMTLARAVGADDLQLLLLTGFLRAVLAAVSDLVAVTALLHKPVHHKSGLDKTSDILRGRFRPARSECSTAGLTGELERHYVLLVRLPLKIYDSVRVRQVLLPGNEVCVHARNHGKPAQGPQM